MQAIWKDVVIAERSSRSTEEIHPPYPPSRRS